MRLKRALQELGKFSEEELGLAGRSYDIIGDVAVVEIPKELKKKEKMIAKALQRIHPHIRTVLKKESERCGEFRLRRLKPLIGRSALTRHREHGAVLEVDVRRAYFSPREATERQRVAAQIRPRERVMVMFAGAGPYAIMAARAQPEVDAVYAVESNPDAVENMKTNIRINKLSHKVVPILGDVGKVCQNYYGRCDRVIMPLPKGAHKFLGTAIRCLKKSGGVIHFYHFAHEKDLFSEAEAFLKGACKRLKRRCQIKNRVRVLPYGPRAFKVCLDARIAV